MINSERHVIRYFLVVVLRYNLILLKQACSHGPRTRLYERCIRSSYFICIYVLRLDLGLSLVMCLVVRQLVEYVGCVIHRYVESLVPQIMLYKIFCNFSILRIIYYTMFYTILLL